MQEASSPTITLDLEGDPPSNASEEWQVVKKKHGKRMDAAERRQQAAFEAQQLHHFQGVRAEQAAAMAREEQAATRAHQVEPVEQRCHEAMNRPERLDALDADT
jgi:hypothetical protein